jgi:DNA invertase Pin-like site-specific DNA recombinase
MNSTEYQDAYRKVWIEMNKIDALKNNLVFSSVNRRSPNTSESSKVAQANGRKGGRSKTGINTPMSENARVVNSMLNYGINKKDIGQMMNIAPRTLERMMQRYGLPRDDDERGVAAE